MLWKDSKIELLYLPPYAPNLNLIERVWKFFKKKVLANAYYGSYLESKHACLNFLRKEVGAHISRSSIAYSRRISRLLEAKKEPPWRLNSPPERDDDYSHHKIVKRDQRFSTEGS